MKKLPVCGPNNTNTFLSQNKLCTGRIHQVQAVCMNECWSPLTVTTPHSDKERSKESTYYLKHYPYISTKLEVFWEFGVQYSNTFIVVKCRSTNRSVRDVSVIDQTNSSPAKRGKQIWQDLITSYILCHMMLKIHNSGFNQ